MRQDIELNEHRQFAEALVELRPEVHRAVPAQRPLLLVHAAADRLVPAQQPRYTVERAAIRVRPAPRLESPGRRS
jgi:alpha-beta hydrolase superfamily lysophospholipase